MLVIVWHSRTGAAEAMARAAFAGAHEALPGCARLIPAADAVPEVMLAAAGYVFICPENLGGVTGMMKEMFDTHYYPLLGRVAGRPYACAIAAGSDGQGAVRQIERIVTGWRLRRVAAPTIITIGGVHSLADTEPDARTESAAMAPKQISREDRQRLRTLGALLAEGLDMGIF